MYHLPLILIGDNLRTNIISNIVFTIFHSLTPCSRVWLLLFRRNLLPLSSGWGGSYNPVDNLSFNHHRNLNFLEMICCFTALAHCCDYLNHVWSFRSLSVGLAMYYHVFIYLIFHLSYYVYVTSEIKFVYWSCHVLPCLYISHLPLELLCVCDFRDYISYLYTILNLTQMFKFHQLFFSKFSVHFIVSYAVMPAGISGNHYVLCIFFLVILSYDLNVTSKIGLVLDTVVCNKISLLILFNP